MYAQGRLHFSGPHHDVQSFVYGLAKLLSTVAKSLHGPGCEKKQGSRVPGILLTKKAVLTVIATDGLDKVFVVVSRISSLGKHKCLPLPHKVPMIKQSMILPNFTLGEPMSLLGLLPEYG